MEILLDHNTTSLVSVSGKEARRHQLGIRCRPWHRSVTLRAPTSSIYETWWSAIENALASPNFLAFPVIDARARQVTIAPVLPARGNAKHTMTLETVVEAEREGELIIAVPMLEAGGPSSPTELDILASWRTWASLDYFATPPSIATPLSINETPEEVGGHIDPSANSTISERISVYSDISEFWSRMSEWDDEIHRYSLPTADSAGPREPTSILQNQIASQRQDDEDKWLDEIAMIAFRQKRSASRKSEHQTSYGQLHQRLR